MWLNFLNYLQTSNVQGNTTQRKLINKYRLGCLITIISEVESTNYLFVKKSCVVLLLIVCHGQTTS